MDSVQDPFTFYRLQTKKYPGFFSVVKTNSQVAQFSIFDNIAKLNHILSVYTQQPVGKPCRQPQYNHRLCMDIVVVYTKGHPRPPGRKAVVYDVSAARTGRMDLPQTPDRSQIYPAAI
jgi:hypothetical protein